MGLSVVVGSVTVLSPSRSRYCALSSNKCAQPPLCCGWLALANTLLRWSLNRFMSALTITPSTLSLYSADTLSVGSTVILSSSRSKSSLSMIVLSVLVSRLLTCLRSVCSTFSPCAISRLIRCPSALSVRACAVLELLLMLLSEIVCSDPTSSLSLSLFVSIPYKFLLLMKIYCCARRRFSSMPSGMPNCIVLGILRCLFRLLR